MRSLIKISGVYIPILTKQNAHVCENWEKWIRFAKYVDREGEQSEQESKNVPESEADGKLNDRQSWNKEVCNITNCPRIPEWPYILMRPQKNLSKKLSHEKLEIGSQCNVWSLRKVKCCLSSQGNKKRITSSAGFFPLIFACFQNVLFLKAYIPEALTFKSLAKRNIICQQTTEALQKGRKKISSLTQHCCLWLEIWHCAAAACLQLPTPPSYHR